MNILLFFYLLFTFILTLPIPQPGLIESALETVGKLTGQVAEMIPKTTESVVAGTVKVAFDDPKFARDALEAMARGATQAALKDPKASMAIAQAAGRGSWIVVSNAAKDQLTTLSLKINAISKAITDMTMATLSKIPGFGKLAPAAVEDQVAAVVEKSPEEQKGLIEAGRRALAAAFGQIASTIDGLKTKMAELQLRAIEVGAKGVIMTGHDAVGKTVITEMSEGVAARLLADSKTKGTLQLAEDAGKIIAEEALKRPGAAFQLAGSAIAGSSPLVAAYLMNSLNEFMQHVGVMVKSAPTKSLQEVQKFGQELQARMAKTLEPLLKQAPRGLVQAPASPSTIKLKGAAVRVAQKSLVIDDAQFVAETQEISNLLKGSLEGFEEIGNSLAKIPNVADAAKVPFSHQIIL